MKTRIWAGIAVILVFILSNGVAQAKPSAGVKVIEKTMARSLVDEVIAKGPQRLIATLRLEPYMVKGRFVGYLITGLTADSPLLNGDGVRPGDIVISVNQEPVERPEQFMRAWEVVGNAKVLQVTFIRGSEKMRYRWRLL